MSKNMNKRATKHKSARENAILKFLTVSSVSSNSIVKGIIDDIIKTAVKTAEIDEQKKNIYKILLINMTQSCQIKQIYISLSSCVYWITLVHTCEPSGGSIFLPILRVPSVPPVNFQNLPPVKKIKYNKILTYILRSIFLEIPHSELPRWRKTRRDTNGKGECHI
jgi:hypothetical protein